MKSFSLFLIVIALLVGGCDSNSVKIRGKVQNLTGTVKLLAEVPGQEGMSVLVQQEVKDGSIDLKTAALQIPARVWIDIAGKRTFDCNLIREFHFSFNPNLIFGVNDTFQGSGLGEKYAELKKTFKEKYDEAIEPLQKKIEKVQAKEQPSINDAVLISVWEMQIERYKRARFNYAKSLIEANPTMEMSLLLLQDELKDSVDLQKRIFQKVNIANKESNIYKNLAEKLK